MTRQAKEAKGRDYRCIAACGTARVIFGPMMRAAFVYATMLTLLGAWGVYAARKTMKPARGWSRRRRFAVYVELLFVASCFGCAAALWTERFHPWTIAPLGLSYLLMIPMPCYFEWVNRVRWIHVARNLLFALVAVFFFSVATGLIPLSSLGLR